jgi:hypothetical protein
MKLFVCRSRNRYWWQRRDRLGMATGLAGWSDIVLAARIRKRLRSLLLRNIGRDAEFVPFDILANLLRIHGWERHGFASTFS